MSWETTAELHHAMDESVAAIHDILLRVSRAELRLDMIRQAWETMTLENKVAVSEICPQLAKAIIQVPV